MICKHVEQWPVCTETKERMIYVMMASVAYNLIHLA